MWQEALFHVVLSTGATELLWWKPGRMQPFDTGVPLLSAAVAELQRVLNMRTGAGGKVVEVAPLSAGEVARGLRAAGVLVPILPDEAAATGIPDWSVPFVLSGARVRAPGGAGGAGAHAVYRFTPRCLSDGTIATVWCTRPPASVHNGTAAVFSIGSGFSTTPVPNGTLVVPSSPATVAPLGFWIVVPE